MKIFLKATIIVGLMSVAYPSFLQLKWKARQSESYKLLGQVVQAEKIWFGEFGKFAPCLSYMGIVRPKSHYYSFGLTHPYGPTGESPFYCYFQLKVWRGEGEAVNAHFFEGNKNFAGKSPSIDQARKIISAGVWDDGQGYRLIAVGDIGDAWALNASQKSLDVLIYESESNLFAKE